MRGTYIGVFLVREPIEDSENQEVGCSSSVLYCTAGEDQLRRFLCIFSARISNKNIITGWNSLHVSGVRRSAVYVSQDFSMLFTLRATLRNGVLERATEQSIRYYLNVSV